MVSGPSVGARRWAWKGAAAAFVLAAGFLVSAALRLPVSRPFDYVCNLGATVAAPSLAAPDDGRVRVVYCVHGLWRTSTSMDRMARSLRAAGYEVHAIDYPSTEGRMASHAALLQRHVEARFAAGPVDEVSFVGHSMGGLVIQEYLRRPDARAPKACVYVATPHRGAILADRRHHWFLFRWVMGDLAAAELVTTAPLHEQPIPFGDRSGAVVGDVGEGSGAIPGRDDGTVGVDEATWEGAADSVLLPYGHTSIKLRERTIRHVLYFLRDLRFAPEA